MINYFIVPYSLNLFAAGIICISIQNFNPTELIVSKTSRSGPFTFIIQYSYYVVSVKTRLTFRHNSVNHFVFADYYIYIFL